MEEITGKHQNNELVKEATRLESAIKTLEDLHDRLEQLRVELRRKRIKLIGDNPEKPMSEDIEQNIDGDMNKLRTILIFCHRQIDDINDEMNNINELV